MAVLWNPGGQPIVLKRITTIIYARESDYIGENTPNQQQSVERMTKIPPSIQYSDAVKEVTEVSHEKLPPMPDKSAFIFHTVCYK